LSYRLEQWRIDLHGNLPKELESRGVLDPKVLPGYAYRDDAILTHKCIENYVTKVVRIYYDSPEKLKDDPELQSWTRELAAPRERGGVGINGMPNDGTINHVSDLIIICTSIISTCTIGHAASNFCQYEEYGFPPNYPAFLSGEPPIDKEERTEEDIVRVLPNKSITLDTMVVTKLLSMKGTKSLGEWEFQYQYDPSALKAEKEFREELVQISKIVQERNSQRDYIYQYPYLDPAIIPNSISI
jgi:arachidonate 5-lipoxygenase